jgi:hypothetical protein
MNRGCRASSPSAILGDIVADGRRESEVVEGRQGLLRSSGPETVVEAFSIAVPWRNGVRYA